MSCGLSEAICAQITPLCMSRALWRAGVSTEMPIFDKTSTNDQENQGIFVGRVESILECLFFCLLSGGKSRFRDSCCSTLASKTLPLTTKNFGRRPPKPDRGCKFRASIEHKLTSGLSQKTVCVYAICSGLSGMSSQFCYNVTKCSWMQEHKSANVRCHV